MSDNELRIIVKGKSDKTIKQIAKKAGLSRNTVTSLISPDGWPRDTKLSTLDKLAYALGYRMEISFKPEIE